jgi:hypothetical protein
MDTWERFSRALEESKQAKKLDPVGHEDADVDNDGDVDSSDKYLKNRRDAIGAKIAADRKKKVEEAKQLDPVGKEDEDIDNDGDHDKTDKYLLNRRKVRSKIIQAKEEVEQIDEVAPLVAAGLAAGGAALAGAAINRARQAAKSGVTAANKGTQIKNPGTGIAGAAYGMQKRNNALNAAMKQLRQSYEPEGELVDEGKADKKLPEHERSAARLARYDNPSGALALGGGQQRARRAEHEERRGVKKEEFEIEEGMSMKDFKQQRSRQKQKEKRESDKIAPNRRKDIHTDRYSPERAARHRANVDPDFEGNDERNYPGGKLKNPKKIRKAKALGELGEGYIEEKALSRAQQRFMGMVYAAKKGETPASPEVAKAAAGMSKKAAKDFAKTKHEGLPEKKEETKEDLSLVDRMIVEFSPLAEGKLDDLLADIRGEDDDKKKVSPQKKTEEERKETAKKQVKRGKSDPSALTRRAAVAGATRLQAEKEKTKRQRERQEYEKKRREEKATQKALKEREQERRTAEEEKKRAKKKRRSELKQDIKNAWSGNIKVGSDKKDTESAGALLSNVGSLAGSVAKTGIALGKYAWKKRQERKEEEKRKKEEKTQQEQFSNWREEFIFEIEDMTTQKDQKKLIDVSKKKNKIEINPNMSEENIQEIAPLVGVLARAAGGAATRGIAARGAGFAARGALQKKAVDIAALKGGEMTADMVQKRLEKKFKNEDEELEEGAAWTKKEGKSEAGGLNEKGRKSYERENPGSDLKAPSKKVGNPRRASFCARMSGMKAKLTSKKTANDPDSRINKSLRAWNC